MTMNEQQARALAAEFEHNRYWFVHSVLERSWRGKLRGHWCVLLIRRDLHYFLHLHRGDASDLQRVKAAQKPLEVGGAS